MRSRCHLIANLRNSYFQHSHQARYFRLSLSRLPRPTCATTSNAPFDDAVIQRQLNIFSSSWNENPPPRPRTLENEPPSDAVGRSPRDQLSMVPYSLPSSGWGPHLVSASKTTGNLQEDYRPMSQALENSEGCEGLPPQHTTVLRISLGPC